MSQIVVRRTKSLWQDRGRAYRILVDGREVACIENDSSVEIRVLPGSHFVRAQVDWCQSPELRVEVKVDDSVALECGPNSTPFLALLYITFLRKNYLWLRRATAQPGINS
jgi:hypothetical protein